MRTILFDHHMALDAKIVDFCGWEMPIQYKGIVLEHLAVREKVGLFDVSHMGFISIEGPDSEAFLDYLSTNEIKNKANNTATYTVWCHENGTCLDDLLIYRIDATHFFVIVNACNREKDLNHLFAHKKEFDVEITNHYDDMGILALQGPNASAVLTEIFPEAAGLKHLQFMQVDYKGKEILISATGYTGSGGYEICAVNALIPKLWDELLQFGLPYGIEPCGLGARDTLRLEMGYALYGHEISDTIYPVDSIASWAVKVDKSPFLGQKALKDRQNSPARQFEYPIQLLDKGVPRENYEVWQNEKAIGKVVSGTFSPSLSLGIAIILVDQKLQENDLVDVLIRDKRQKAKVVTLPFYKKQKKGIKNEVYTNT